MSNCGHVMLHGHLCPIVGRISMDYTTINVDEVPEAKIGDEVTCLGDRITVADWARYKGTIPYEIICAIGNRVMRRYVDDELPVDQAAAVAAVPARAPAREGAAVPAPAGTFTAAAADPAPAAATVAAPAPVAAARSAPTGPAMAVPVLSTIQAAPAEPRSLFMRTRKGAGAV